MLPPLETVPPKTGSRTERVRVSGGESTNRAKARRGRGQPSEDEWTDFFQKYALDWLMSGYIWLCFRGIDRDTLDPGILASLEADEEDIAAIAEALADFMHGTGVSKQYGRKITSSAAFLDAAHAFTMWGIRVNKSAARIRREQGTEYPKPSRRTRPRPAHQHIPAEVIPNGNPAEAQTENVQPIRIYNPGGA
jgi:hypothetical protein